MEVYMNLHDEDSIKTDCDKLNEFFFPTNVLQDQKGALVEEISKLREQLFKKIEELNAIHYNKTTSFTKEMLNSLYKKYPAAYVSRATDGISVGIRNGSITFYYVTSKHEHINFYITPPLYNITINFLVNGRFKGYALQPTYGFDILSKVQKGLIKNFKNLSENSIPVGHPNARMSTKIGDTYNLGSICTGNNTFPDRYYNYIKTLSGTPSELINILLDALQWITSANLSDMYDSYISIPYRANIPEADIAFYGENLFDKVYRMVDLPKIYSYLDINNIVSKNILSIRDKYIDAVYRDLFIYLYLINMSWTFILFKHQYDITQYYSRTSLQQAIIYTLAWLYSDLIDINRYVYPLKYIANAEDIILMPYKVYKDNENTFPFTIQYPEKLMELYKNSIK